MLLLWWWACGVPSADRTRPVAASAARAEIVAHRGEGREEGSVSIVAMGDILVHQAVEDAAATFAAREERDPRYGYNAVFEGIRPLVELSDFAFANLETPVAPSRFRPRRPRVFNADPVVVESLVDVGFDLVSLANNHAFDQGPEGLEETMQVLGERALSYVGVGPTCEAAHAPFWVRHDGLSVAFLAATEILNENWNVRDDATCAAVLSPDVIVTRAAEARAQGADFVVLSLHWGDEYEIEPGTVRRRIARRLVEGGIDVILGHHAHVLQPVERIETADGRVALVAYGLGNLVSNQAAWYRPGVHRSRSARPRDGLALSFRLSRRRVGRGDARSVRREIVDVRAVPLWTVNNEPVRTRASGTEIRVLPTRDAVAELLGEEPTDDREATRRRAWIDELRDRADQVERDAKPQVVPPRDG